MLHKLKTDAEMIALEAMTPSQTLNASLERMPEFITDVKNFITDLFSFDSEATPNLSMDNELLRLLSKANYGKMTSFETVTPPGLKVDFAKYLSILESFAFGQMELLVPKVLEPFNRWLGTVINDPEKLMSIRSDKNIPNLSLYDVEGLKKSISDCFDNTRVTTKGELKNTYRSLRDITQVTTNLDKVITQVERQDQKEIINYVKSISERLNLLMEIIAKPNSEIRVSGTTVRTIVDISYVIARECEFFSVYRYQLQSFAIAVKDTNEKIKEQLKAA